MHEIKISDRHSRRFRNFVIAAVIAVFCVGLALNVYIDLSYWATMPRVPEASTGRVVRIVVNHGTVVYVTPQEFLWADRIYRMGFPIVIAAGLSLLAIKIYWAPASEARRE